MINIEANERRERDDMIARGEIPAPDAETLPRLEALGVRCHDIGVIAHVTLPARWSPEADPLDHRRWFLLDERGIRRVACFWKAAGLFDSGPGRGSIALMEADLLIRRWEGRDSAHFFQTQNLRLTLSCVRCRKPEVLPVEIEGRVAEEKPGYVRAFVEHHERLFLERHVCEGAQALRVEVDPSLPPGSWYLRP